MSTILGVRPQSTRCISCQSRKCVPDPRERRPRKPAVYDCHSVIKLQATRLGHLNLRTSHAQPVRSQLPGDFRQHAGCKGFVHVMGQTGALALTSKLLGLVREQTLSTSYGLGGIADAFSITSTIPLLALSGVGGLNGAIHCAMASTCKNIVSARYEKSSD